MDADKIRLNTGISYVPKKYLEIKKKYLDMIILHEKRQPLSIPLHMPRHLRTLLTRLPRTHPPPPRLLHALHRDPRYTLHVRNGEPREDLLRDRRVVLRLGLVELFFRLGEPGGPEGRFLGCDAGFFGGFEAVGHGGGGLAADDDTFGGR